MSCIEHSPCRQATWIGSLLLYFLVVTLVSYITSEGLRFLTCKVGVMCTPGTVVRHHEVTALGTKSSSPEKDEISPIKCWGSKLAWLSECWWRRQWHHATIYVWNTCLYPYFILEMLIKSHILRRGNFPKLSCKLYSVYKESIHPGVSKLTKFKFF